MNTSDHSTGDFDISQNNTLHDSGSQYQILNFLKSNPDIAGIANYERLCKLKDKTYVICPDYCCGEFWESKPQFCCPNNFKPIRNLFYFLLTAFSSLFATIMIYVFIEFLVNLQVSKKISALKRMNPKIQTYNIETQATMKDLGSSDETSLDEESSLDERVASTTKRSSRPAKQFINKHSQIFKDMSKMSNKRLAKSRSSLESNRNRVFESNRFTTKSLRSGEDPIDHLRTLASSNPSQESIKSLKGLHVSYKLL